MTFKEAKSKIVEALLADTYAIEERGDKSKNLLCDNAISNQDAAAIVQRTKGHQHSTSPHHAVPTITVWIFRPDDWYVKVYFTSNAVVISFHRSG